MSFGPQRPAPLEELPAEEPKPVPQPEIVDTYETRHLCLLCVHATVCALPAAIRTLGADGQVVISVCAAFFEIPKT